MDDTYFNKKAKKKKKERKKESNSYLLKPGKDFYLVKMKISPTNLDASITIVFLSLKKNLGMKY